MRRAVWLTVLVVACSDYDLKSGAGDETLDSGSVPDVTSPTVPMAEVPDLRVTPDSIRLGAVCGTADTEVLLENIGNGALDISELRVAGAGWGELNTVPSRLVPGESFVLELQTTGGTATVEIDSNDPDSPTTSVPVDAPVDQPPEVSVLSPANQAVLPSGGDVVLEALVEDDLDRPGALTVSWRSDVDGPLGVAATDASGVATTTWPAPRTDGDHLLTVDVVDTCGHATSEAVSVCQQAGFDVDELDIATWNFEGSANWDAANSWVQLTPALTNQAGTAFNTSATVSGDNVEINFSFYIGDGSGADGISLTALDTTRMAGFVGATGGGIGYGGLPGWSIEVDVYYNASDPTTEDHLAFVFDGENSVTPAAWVTLPEMEDTGWHEMVVQVLAPRVTVSIDGVVYLDQDITGHFAFPAYVGFTAATGSLTHDHRIDSLIVTEYVCPE